jgi:mannosyltransferase OCH1-like enzyme
MRIPRIIHQTWKSNQLSTEFRESLISWKRQHPDWQYILWTDEMNRNLIASYFAWFLPFYDNYEYNIQRADVVRYFILYKYGGIYVDLDVLSRQSLDKLFTELDKYNDVVALVSSGNLSSYASNWLMISTALNSFWIEVWKMLIDSYNNKNCWWCIGKHFKVMYSTGPGMINRVVKNSKKNIVLLGEQFNPCSVCDPKPCTCSNCYITHTTGQSWNAWDSLFLNAILCKWQYALFILVIIIILVNYPQCL